MKLLELFENTKPFFRNLGGYWITSQGTLEEVDHAQGLHHSTIAMEYLGMDQEQDHLPEIADRAVDAMLDKGWIRVSLTEPNHEFMLEMVNPSKLALGKLKSMVKDYKEYETYFLNNKVYDNWAHFYAAINRYHSVKGSTQPS